MREIPEYIFFLKLDIVTNITESTEKATYLNQNTNKNHKS